MFNQEKYKDNIKRYNEVHASEERAVARIIKDNESLTEDLEESRNVNTALLATIDRLQAIVDRQNIVLKDHPNLHVAADFMTTASQITQSNGSFDITVQTSNTNVKSTRQSNILPRSLYTPRHESTRIDGEVDCEPPSKRERKNEHVVVKTESIDIRPLGITEKKKLCEFVEPHRLIWKTGQAVHTPLVSDKKSADIHDHLWSIVKNMMEKQFPIKYHVGSLKTALRECTYGVKVLHTKYLTGCASYLEEA